MGAPLPVANTSVLSCHFEPALSCSSNCLIRWLLSASTAVDCCITKAPCGGERVGKSPVDRGKGGLKRSLAVDADGIPLGIICAPANRHDSPLLAEALDSVEASFAGPLPEGASVHLDRGYDSDATRKQLEERALIGVISERGKSRRCWEPPNVRRWSEATPGTTPTRSLCVVHQEVGAGHRLLGRLVKHDHYRRQARPKSVDLLSLGRPTCLKINDLLAQALRKIFENR